MIASEKWNDLVFADELAKSIQDVEYQVKSLCEYLQELRVNKLLLNNYSPKYVSSKIDKVAQKIPYLTKEAS